MTAKIDWEKAEQMLISGCPGSEVAGFFGIHPKTFYRRVEEEKNMPFGEYLQQKKQKGKALIRHQQFIKALGYTDKGDNTLLIWLGKCHLDQKENNDNAPPNDEEIKTNLDFIHSTDIDAMRKAIEEKDKEINELKLKANRIDQASE